MGEPTRLPNFDAFEGFLAQKAQGMNADEVASVVKWAEQMRAWAEEALKSRDVWRQMCAAYEEEMYEHVYIEGLVEMIEDVERGVRDLSEVLEEIR